MWPTSTGNRTLQGAEAALVAAGIAVMLESLDERLGEDDDDEIGEPTADMQLGIAVFDSLTIPQRVAMLHHVATHLLTDSMAVSEETSAVDDATIAAIFLEIQDQVMMEAGLDPDDFSETRSEVGVATGSTCNVIGWRSMVLAAYRQLNPEGDEYDEIGIAAQSMDISIDAWEDVIEILASAILWDRDFELVDGFMDENPSAASHRKRLLGIHENYFVQPPLDPTFSQTRLLLAQAKSLATRRPR